MPIVGSGTSSNQSPRSARLFTNAFMLHPPAFPRSIVSNPAGCEPEQVARLLAIQFKSMRPNLPLDSKAQKQIPSLSIGMVGQSSASAPLKPNSEQASSVDSRRDPDGLGRIGSRLVQGKNAGAEQACLWPEPRSHHARPATRHRCGSGPAWRS